MRLLELKNRVEQYHAEYGDDLIVTDGRGLSINFMDVIGVPVQGTPKPTEEQLHDPDFTRPYNDVLMISTVTTTEINADAVNQAYSFEYWFIELQKVFMLVDGTEAEQSEKENYRADYNLGLSPAEVVEKYSMGALNRKPVDKPDVRGTDSGDW